uniref:S4 RNA-binding domain-containing protein n=1 Tax=Schistocephalus solidus TaxID=70667 RepID=A0A183S9J0_SCHSO
LPRQVYRELKSCLQVKVYQAVNRNTSKIVPEIGLTSDSVALVTPLGQGDGEKPRVRSRKDLHLIAIQRQQQQQPVKYYSDNGFRKVVPYYYTFTAFCKRRWVGQKLYNVIASEFNFDSEEMIKHRMTHGQIKVNGSPVGLDYMLSDSDLVEHNVHRHERLVLDDQLLVVNKPSSLHVHPCGQFHHNTLAKILYNERHISNLYVIHRLDRTRILGFPLVDDPLYNSYDWGPTKGAFAKYVEPRFALIEAWAASRSRSAYLQAAVSDVNSPQSFCL